MRHLPGREIYREEKGCESIQSVESLAYLSYMYLPMAENTVAGDLHSRPLLPCPLTSLPFCPVLLLGDTIYSDCLLLDGSNVPFYIP